MQLAWRLSALIRSGRLAPGTRLPGVRELAQGTEVNVNTARAVYGRLEEEGLAVSRHGHGTFVAEDAGISPALEQLAAEAAENALALGLDPRELARALYVASSPDLVAGDAHLPPAGEDLDEAQERAARRSLRAQIARLEAELSNHRPAETAAEAPGGGATARALPRVADIGELEAARDALAERLKDTLAAAERAGRRQGAARAHLEEMVADPAAHPRQVISSEEIGDPGATSWEVVPAWGPVGELMSWWRIRVTSERER